jgi:exopolysaccharide biosynthesis protein
MPLKPRDTKYQMKLLNTDKMIFPLGVFASLWQKVNTIIKTGYSSVRLLLIFCLLSFAVSLNAQIKGFGKVKWEKERIAPGLVWKSSHTLFEDTIPQNINVLVVNLHKRKVSVLYDPKKNLQTSRQAASVNVLAAVNAGFFSIKDGGAVTYLKTGGQIVDSDTSKKWPASINFNGAVMIDSMGHFSIGPKMTNSWFDSHKEILDVIVSGPLLLSNKKKVVLPQTSLVITSHPRTSIGAVSRHKIILVTLDGRTADARGMTLMKLTDLMISLHCRDAVNLDGGGSTTMWINGKPFNGVVNMPCDNKKFDHEGERAVSDILIVR